MLRKGLPTLRRSPREKVLTRPWVSFWMPTLALVSLNLTVGACIFALARWLSASHLATLAGGQPRFPLPSPPPNKSRAPGMEKTGSGSTRREASRDLGLSQSHLSRLFELSPHLLILPLGRPPGLPFTGMDLSRTCCLQKVCPF